MRSGDESDVTTVDQGYQLRVWRGHQFIKLIVATQMDGLNSLSGSHLLSLCMILEFSGMETTPSEKTLLPTRTDLSSNVKIGIIPTETGARLLVYSPPTPSTNTTQIKGEK